MRLKKLVTIPDRQGWKPNLNFKLLESTRPTSKKKYGQFDPESNEIRVDEYFVSNFFLQPNPFKIKVQPCRDVIALLDKLFNWYFLKFQTIKKWSLVQ